MSGFRLIVTVLFSSALFVSCNSGSGRSFVPSIVGYTDRQREVFVLPDELLEISGLAHVSGSRIAAINDEQGELFFLDLANDSLSSFKFAGEGDFEELVRTDSGYFVLESNGDLHHVTEPFTSSEQYKFDVKGKFEFESLVWYKQLDKLVLVTKDQRKKKRSDGITAYSFDIKTKTFDQQPFFEIPSKEIFIKLENYNAECKPSGAAINPRNGRLYLIASVGRVLLECSADGKLTRIYKINPTHFSQPEGISFAANGDMYISNEGLEGKATILKFPYVADK